jgi:hypothetical protein
MPLALPLLAILLAAPEKNPVVGPGNVDIAGSWVGCARGYGSRRLLKK